MKGKVTVESGKPLQFEGDADTNPPESAEQKNAAMIADALKSYLDGADDILSGKYACFSAIAPKQLRQPCDVFVLRCTDGVFVRYDSATDQKRAVRAAAIDRSLREVARQFSDGALLLDVGPQDLQEDDRGLMFEWIVTDADGTPTQKHQFSLIMIGSSNLPAGYAMPSPPARPICLVGIQSEIDIQIGGYVAPVDMTTQPEASDLDNFIAHSSVQLPVGWLAIEIYPLLDDQYWQAEFATTGRSSTSCQQLQNVTCTTAN